MFISDRKEAYIFRGTLLLASIILLTLTLIKTSNLPNFSINDKVVHLLSFLILAFLADFSFSVSHYKITKSFMLLSFGIVIEIAQYFTSSRTAEWQDVVADMLGIALYWLLAPWILKLAFWRKRKP